VDRVSVSDGERFANGAASLAHDCGVTLAEQTAGAGFFKDPKSAVLASYKPDTWGNA
jgi:hypothetical protein